MPFFRLETNLTRSKIPATFAQSTTKLISAALGKPIKRCGLNIVPDQLISFEGSTDLCGYGSLSSIGGIGPEENKKVSALIFDHIEKELGIPRNRMFISFTDMNPSNVANAGTTIQDLRNQGRVLETNLTKNKIPATFLQSMVKVIATALNKPETRCGLAVVPDQLMSFGGSTDLCGYASLLSIGSLGVEENKNISRAIFDHIEKELGIPKNRMYIHFNDALPFNVGSRGTTVQDLRTQGLL